MPPREGFCIDGSVKDSVERFVVCLWLLVLEDWGLLALKSGALKISDVLREANFVADAVSSIGFHFGNLHIWDRSCPAVESRALLFDFLGSSSSRGDSL
ncbi:hypothetical protein ACFX1Q_037569 [Malus domestica]